MKLVYSLTLILIITSLSAQSRPIHKLDNFKADGLLSEWNTVEAIILSSNPSESSTEVSKSGKGVFDNINDVLVTIKLAWTESGLAAAISWKDDLFDTKHLPFGLSTWKDSNGNTRDRMYSYDNMGIRLTKEDGYLYNIWLSPDGQLPFQWSRLRNGPRGTPRVEIDQPRIYSYQRSINDLQLEILWPWELLNLSPNSNNLTMQLILADNDLPQADLAVKGSSLIYFFLSQKVRFVD